MRSLQIGVMGSVTSPHEKLRLHELAENVGRCIADQGAVYVFGAEGHDGHLPDVAYRGVRARGGRALAITKGKEKQLFPDDDRTVIIPSGMVHGGGWEAIIALACDAMIVIGGGAGSLQEMTIAYQAGIPIVALRGTGGWADRLADSPLDYREKAKVTGASDPAEAVRVACMLAMERLKTAQ